MVDKITLNGQSFSGNALKELCRQKRDQIQTASWEKEVYAFIEEWISSQSTIEVYSSGTTGRPKTITLTKKELVDSAKRTESYFNLTTGQHALLCLPVQYIAGKMMLVRAFVTGLHLWLVPPSSNPLKAFSQSLDFIALTPHQLSHSLEALKKRQPDVKQIIVGGAPIPNHLLPEIKDLPCKVYETYGMTETGSHIAIKPLNGPNASRKFQLLSGIDIEADDRQCLLIHFPDDLQKEPIQTNDIVEIQEKSFIWLGRYDHVINSGGVKFSPERLEEKLSGALAFPFVISSKDDKKLGEKIILVIETTKLKNSELVTLKTLLNEKLGPLEQPKEIALLDVLPKTESGKLKRKELRNLLNRSSNVYFVPLKN